MVAQGLADTDEQDAEEELSGHDGFDNGLLHGATVVLRRRREGSEPELPEQFLVGGAASLA